MRQCNILFILLVGLLYAVPQAFASPEPAPTVTGPHIAVLLPLKSKTLGPAAQVVKSGIEAAANLNLKETGRPALPIVIYSIGEQETEVMAAYDMAQDNQAQVVIGPLGRSATTALAKAATITLPTIALSEVESTLLPTGPWYTLTLSVEQEAKQVAQIAYHNGARSAVTIQTGSALEQRIQSSFMSEWQQLGGTISNSLTLKLSKAELGVLRASWDI
jgi:outer membrane PBP1 activator LpoA protein